MVGSRAGAAQVEGFVEERARSSIGRLRASSVKLMLDGVIENFTASVLEPYLDGGGRSTGNRGIDFIDPELLKGFVTRLDALGFQAHFHALGDRAVRQGLDAVEAARRANGMSDTRPHLAHLQIVDPADWPRFRRARRRRQHPAALGPQRGPDDRADNPVPAPERAALQYPFRSLAAAGARLVGGSDWMVSTPNVLQQVEVAVRRVDPDHRDASRSCPTRRSISRRPSGPTRMGSAWANHADDATGSIEVGKLADLVVLDRDIERERRRPHRRRAGPPDARRGRGRIRQFAVMKLLLTSAGVKNPSIHAALVDLLGKPIAECDALAIPTASYGHAPQGIQRARNFLTGQAPTPMVELGWKNVGVLELTALPSLPRESWLPLVEEADVLLANGGDALYLAHHMRLSGLADLLPSLRAVWVGLSAGSMVMTPRIGPDFVQWQSPTGDDRTLGIVDFHICPHVNGDDQPGNTMAEAEQWAAGISGPCYIVDDQTAIQVVDGKVDVISEGRWKLVQGGASALAGR